MMDRNHSAESDTDLSAAYREVAGEITPVELDRFILDMAGKEARASTSSALSGRWYRPIAIVASVCLSLLLVLQLGESVLITPPEDGSEQFFNDPEPDQDNPFQEAAKSAASQLQQLEADANASLSNSSVPMTQMDSATVSGPSINETALPPADFCTAEQRADASSWWACIAKLESTGLTQAAEAELQSLLRRFPQGAVPE